MSKTHREILTCPQCGYQWKHKIWDTYHANLLTRSSSLMKKFFNTCPLCRLQFVTPYPCLYHDTRKKFMVFLIPDTSQRILRSHELQKFYPENYVFRLESDLNAMLERVKLLSAGINDRLFEIFRTSIILSVQKRKPDIKQIRFKQRSKDQFIFLLFVDGEIPKYEIHISCEPYRTALTHFLQLDCSKENLFFEKIDSLWAEESKQLELFSNQ